MIYSHNHLFLLKRIEEYLYYSDIEHVYQRHAWKDYIQKETSLWY